MKDRWFPALLLAAALGWLLVAAVPQIGEQVRGRAAGAHQFSPRTVAFSESKLRELKLPAGFEVSVFATGIEGARMLAVADEGTVYVTVPDNDEVLALNGGQHRVVARGLGRVHGIFLRGDKAYLAGERSVWTATVNSDGTFSQPQEIVRDLPRGGRHPLRTIAIGPDGDLYISIGSTCDACEESDPRSAALLRASPDGRNLRVFARGLRNTIGFDWHPQTRDLWGADNGSDWRGDEQPPEELNELVDGGDYGWPWCVGDRKPDPQTPYRKSGTTPEQYCAKTRGSALNMQAHMAPIAMVFYNGAQFPADYRGDAFIAFHGSWNRIPASGYKVVRVKFENGKPVRAEDFLSGFLAADGQSQFGRPAGLAVMKDGSLLVSDDENGVVYKISYPARK